jgi:hypothetical protein
MLGLLESGKRVAPVIMLAAWASGVAAQVNTGSMSGRVLDPQQALVPKARAEAVRTETNIGRQTETNEYGHYSFPSLQPGTYELRVQAGGFKSVKRTGIRLNVGDELSVDIALELGPAAEQVTVEAAAPLMNVTSATLGQVIEGRRITDLPLNGRDPFALAGLVPGVVTLAPDPGAAVGIYPTNPGINGAASGTSAIVMDGATNDIPRDRAYMSVYSPTVDVVQEFRVQTNALSAEYGRYNGGVLSVVTKSGTNQFHGTLYEFLRNSLLDANNFFANRQGIPLAATKRSQFGGTIGGPVSIPRLYGGKNRTFFFFNYDGLRERPLTALSFTVPTQLERVGDFSRTVNSGGQQVRIFDPDTTRQNPSGSGNIRDPFPGNVIPRERLNPTAVRLVALYPVPNNSQLAGNSVMSDSKKNTNNSYNARVDHQITPAHSLMVRFGLQNPTVGEPNFWGNIGNPSLPALTQTRRSASLQHTFVASPSLLFTFQYGLTRQTGGRVAWSNGLDITELGFAASFRDHQQVRALPQFAITGYNTISGIPSIITTQLAHTFSETVSKVRGKHSWKAGYEYRGYYNNNRNTRNSHGSFSTTQAFTQGPNPSQASTTAGNGMAALLLGLLNSGSLSSEPSVCHRSSYTSVFLQDDWRVSRRLTLNPGLRYEVGQPRTERHDRITIFDLTAPSPIAGKVPQFPNLRGAMLVRGPDNRRAVATDYDNFGPRFGFAYHLFRQTSVRGGYGIFYGTTAIDSNISSNFLYGIAGVTNVIASYDGVRPLPILSDPFWAGYTKPLERNQVGPDATLGLSNSSVALYRTIPMFQQWNLSIQQGLGRTMLIEAAYVANKGNHVNLPGSLSFNALTAEQYALGAVNQELVPNPFAGVITDPTSTLSRATVTRGQLLLSYPQYTGLTGEFAALGNMIYHSLQLKVEKRMSRGFSLLSAYTWSKNLNDLSSPIAYPNNLQLERGLDTGDVPHRLTLSGSWEVPVGRRRAIGGDWNRALDLIAGGWQLNGIAIFQSGVPITLSSTSGTRPNRVKKGEQPTGRIQDRLTRAFDTSAFAVPAAFTYGNSARTHGDIRRHGVNTFDLSVFKTLRLREKLQAQIRLEAFNAFNRAQFAAPGAQAGSSSFGVITNQANTPRQMQVAVKLLF